LKAFIEQFGYGCISPHCKRCPTQYSNIPVFLKYGITFKFMLSDAKLLDL